MSGKRKAPDVTPGVGTVTDCEPQNKKSKPGETADDTVKPVVPLIPLNLYMPCPNQCDVSPAQLLLKLSASIRWEGPVTIDGIECMKPVLTPVQCDCSPKDCPQNQQLFHDISALPRLTAKVRPGGMDGP